MFFFVFFLIVFVYSTIFAKLTFQTCLNKRPRVSLEAKGAGPPRKLGLGDGQVAGSKAINTTTHA